MFKVEVDVKKCNGCGECVDICPMEVFELQDNKSVPVKPEECIGCESCVVSCEQEAVTITDV